MATLDKENIERSIGRRKEDWLVRDQIKQYKQLFNVGQIITSEMNMDFLFELILVETNKIMETKRSTVFLYDEKNDELWSLVATGMEKNEIRIPADYGVAGRVFQSKTPLIINDAYNDPRFFPEVDKRSGFKTDNILSTPLINRKGKCIGVLEALNKAPGDFKGIDIELIESISHYVAVALENAKLYEDVKNYTDELQNTLVRIETLERVKGQLTKFVPHSVAKMVEHDPDQLIAEKIPKDVTILFIDIQAFSKVTEGFDQRLVNDMVESHFSGYLDCIRRHGGEVNETSGDGLMVMFKEGPMKTHAKEAVSAGLEIVEENIRLNEKFPYPWGKVDLHLGINSGKALVGATKMKSIAGERWTYTASGFVTVLAAHIGALSEKTRLYVGPETHGIICNDYGCRCIGNYVFKNCKNPIAIYWVKNT